MIAGSASRWTLGGTLTVLASSLRGRVCREFGAARSGESDPDLSWTPLTSCDAATYRMPSETNKHRLKGDAKNTTRFNR